LTISKQLVELMGGEIDVNSELGEGSTFWFTAHFRRQALDQVPSSEFRDELEGRRVLVVDDNRPSRRILAYKLKNWNMQTETAASAMQALERLREAAQQNAAYELAILDWMMPDMDGVALAGAIKADPLISATRLMMLSAVSADDNPRPWREAGIECYLSKPARLTEIRESVSQLLDVQASYKVSSTGTQLNTQERESLLGGTILVVEDNPVNLEVALGMLEMLGCSAETAENGHQALETLSQGRFDAILMDCQMPEMDGFEATREIRRREQQAGSSRPFPIIALTANAMKGDRERCLAAGMDDFLSKPFQKNQLRQVLEHHLKRVAENGQRKAADSVNNTPREDATASLDVAVLDELRALQGPGRPNVLHKIIHHYLEDTPNLLASLQEAIAKECYRNNFPI
jgi:CheY-like chemotaxis protein